ncbi:MAG: uroporphyrinogen-III C-methyltransferase [Gammaproteobacteria bacterium]|nr:uroporphyrinogen-III C-methyltransferase [Gammaproteobacteria bacterium]
MVKDLEASFEEDKIEAAEMDESEAETKSKPAYMIIFVIITFLISAYAVFMAYFVNEQMEQIQVREEKRNQYDVSVLKPLSQNLKVTQREIGKQAVSLSEQREAQNKLFSQTKQIEKKLKDNSQVLAVHEQNIQKNRENLLSTNQLIEDSFNQQLQVNTELKKQVQHWLKVETDKIMLNLAQKEQQLEQLRKSAQPQLTNKKGKSESIVKNKESQKLVEAKPAKTIQNNTIQKSKEQHPQKVLLMPDLSILQVYEARSMAQLLLDSLSFTYTKDTFIKQLNQIQSRLHNVSGNQVIRRIIEQTIRDLPAEQASIVYQHRKQLSELIVNVQKLKVLNEQLSFKNDINGNNSNNSNENNKSSTDNKVGSSLDNASNKFLSEIKSLITFRHTNKKAQHLIAPEQAFVLKQSLGLKLEVTRFALIEKDKTNYHALLNETLDFLNRYFDIKSTEVSQMNQILLKLLDQPFEIQTPIVEKSLQAVLEAIDQLISRLSTENKDIFSGVNN